VFEKIWGGRAHKGQKLRGLNKSRTEKKAEKNGKRVTCRRPKREGTSRKTVKTARPRYDMREGATQKSKSLKGSGGKGIGEIALSGQGEKKKKTQPRKKKSSVGKWGGEGGARRDCRRIETGKKRKTGEPGTSQGRRKYSGCQGERGESARKNATPGGAGESTRKEGCFQAVQQPKGLTEEDNCTEDLKDQGESVK